MSFQYIRLIPNLPDGYAGIYTQGEGPEDTWPKHLHDLELIGLGVGKGRSELRQEADAICQVPLGADEVQQPQGKVPPSPDAPPRAPAYLGLLVDEVRGEVRREGKIHRGGAPKVIHFEVESAEWHTFLVAFRAGERGATEEEWRNGYPGVWQPEPKRKTKGRVTEKLSALDVMFKSGSLLLLDIPSPQS